MEDEADRLLAVTLYLMSCHARSGCPRLAGVVRHHLALLARHGGAGERVRDIAKKMGCAWSAIQAHDERHAASRAAGEIGHDGTTLH